MDKCEICKQKVTELFLDKVKGTYLKRPGSSKKYLICFECQKKCKTKAEILEKIK